MAVVIAESSSFPSAIDSRDGTLLGEVAAYPSATDSRDSVVLAESSTYASTSLTQVPQQTTVQKVWDTVAGDWVLWATEGIDFNGGSYPGPGVWGAQTSDFRVLTLKYTRG